MKNRTYIKLLSWVLLVTGPAVADTKFSPPSGAPALVGNGYNPVTGEIKGPCVVPTPIQPLVPATTPGTSAGQQIDAHIAEISRYEDLRRGLGLDATAAASFGLGLFSADTRVSYFTSNHFNSQNYYLFVHVKVENQTEALSHYTLTEQAATLQSNNPQQFQTTCGSEFIAARVTGGEFNAIIEIETRSNEDREQVSAQIRGSGGGFFASASANVELKNTLTSISRNHRITVELFQTGGGGQLPPRDPQAVIDYALSFPTRVLQVGGSGWLYSVTTVPYQNITTLTSPPSTFAAQQKILQSMALDLSTALSLRNDVLFVIQHPEQFENTGPTMDADLANQMSALTAIVNQLNTSAAECGAHLPNPCTLVTFSWPSDKRPRRKVVGSDVKSYRFGSDNCTDTLVERCAGLNNRGSVYDSGITVRSGNLLDLRLNYLVEETNTATPGPVVNQVQNFVCKKMNLTCVMQSSVADCVSRTGTTDPGELANLKNACKIVAPLCTQYSSSCGELEDHWIETTTYTGQLSSTFRMEAPPTEAKVPFVLQNLWIRFRAFGRISRTTDCPIEQLQRTPGVAGALSFIVANFGSCTPFQAGSDDPLALSFFYKGSAPAVTYRVGVDTKLWNGRTTQQSVAQTYVPLAIVSGLVTVR